MAPFFQMRPFDLTELYWPDSELHKTARLPLKNTHTPNSILGHLNTLGKLEEVEFYEDDLCTFQLFGSVFSIGSDKTTGATRPNDCQLRPFASATTDRYSIQFNFHQNSITSTPQNPHPQNFHPAPSTLRSTKP